MRLCLINPSNPIVGIVKVKKGPWNRYRVWKPLSLMVPAGATPPGVGNLSYGGNSRMDYKACADFKRHPCQRHG